LRLKKRRQTQGSHYCGDSLRFVARFILHSGCPGSHLPRDGA
jgi:hypothetical protein